MTQDREWYVLQVTHAHGDVREAEKGFNNAHLALDDAERELMECRESLLTAKGALEDYDQTHS